MAITATEHVYTWGGLQAKRDPLKAAHRPSVVPLLSGRQPHVSSGNGCAQHALVTTFDVLGPLLIVFDEPAARVKSRRWREVSFWLIALFSSLTFFLLRKEVRVRSCLRISALVGA